MSSTKLDKNLHRVSIIAQNRNNVKQEKSKTNFNKTYTREGNFIEVRRTNDKISQWGGLLCGQMRISEEGNPLFALMF